MDIVLKTANSVWIIFSKEKKSTTGFPQKPVIWLQIKKKNRIDWQYIQIIVLTLLRNLKIQNYAILNVFSRN